MPILVAKNFERASGAPARNMPVYVTLRGDNVHIVDLVTDSVGFASTYLEPGQYDWVGGAGENFRIPFDVLAGSTVNTVYEHVQNNAAAQWTIPHNLGRSINPTVFIDTYPGIPVWTRIEHPDENTTLVLLPEPHTGVANF